MGQQFEVTEEQDAAGALPGMYRVPNGGFVRNLKGFPTARMPVAKKTLQRRKRTQVNSMTWVSKLEPQKGMNATVMGNHIKNLRKHVSSKLTHQRASASISLHSGSSHPKLDYCKDSCKLKVKAKHREVEF